MHHHQDIDSFALQVLEAVQVAAEVSLPCPNAGGGRAVHKGGGGHAGVSAVPGWKDLVKPYRDNAHFWHQI